jgi:hypothetical protein
MIGVQTDSVTALSAKRLSNFHLVIAGIVVVAALVVISASQRMTERAIDRAVGQREAARQFLASELSVLRIMAITSESAVPARLYLGIEECFQKSVAVPFDSDNVSSGRQAIAACAEMELGRLHSQGGAAMAERGRELLRQLALLK